MQGNLTLLPRIKPLIIKKKKTKLCVPTYKPLALLFMFFSFSIIGWLWETVLMFFISGSLVNRGVLHGFWLPIYGFGGLLFLVLLNRFRQRPLLVFILGIVTSGVIEYSTSWCLETFFHASWWDYSQSKINLHGRVSLEGLVFFAAAGCLILYFLAPRLNRFLEKIPRRGRYYLAAGLVILFLADTVFSLANPNMGIGITC